MSYHFFAYLSRMRNIARWSLMCNSIPENIQEHSHMVAVIAHALGIIRRDVFGIPCNPEECASVALYHDCSEILTGDLPTPIKYHSIKIQEAYKQVEQLASDRLLSTLPEEIRPSFAPFMGGEAEKRVHDIVKAADKLSAYLKCVEERRAGASRERSPYPGENRGRMCSPCARYIRSSFSCSESRYASIIAAATACAIDAFSMSVASYLRIS